MTEAEPFPAVVPAATVVIFRHGQDQSAPELLMVQRSKAMRFAGGAAVFPGGRVDPADAELAAAVAPEEDPVVATAKVAGIRETLEETGLAIGLRQSVTAEQAFAARALLLDQGALAPVLERFGWTLDLSKLIPFAHWCPRWEGAFDTRFFLYDLGTGAVDVTIDDTENTHLFWAAARQTLEMADAGEASVIFPTRRNLERLAQFASFTEARAHAQATPVTRISPQQVERDGETWLTIPEGLGYPVTGQPLTSVKRG